MTGALSRLHMCVCVYTCVRMRPVSTVTVYTSRKMPSGIFIPLRRQTNRPVAKRSSFRAPNLRGSILLMRVHLPLGDLHQTLRQRIDLSNGELEILDMINELGTAHEIFS